MPHSHMHACMHRHQYQRVLGHSPKSLLTRLDVEVHGFMRKAIHLPSDAPNAVLHSRVADGGLGVQQFTTLIPALCREVNERLALSADARVARIGRVHLESSGTSSRAVREATVQYHHEQLYTTVDGRGLREATLAPPSRTAGSTARLPYYLVMPS